MEVNKLLNYLGVEMCEVVEAEILTVKDPPIPICVTPKPILEKSR